jgi:hypothetical protein
VKSDPDDDVLNTTPYDADFYIWTQEQAALLRQLPRDLFALDIDHIAEEIEDMGRSEISKVSSLLRQVLIHLLKLVTEPDSPSREHWLSEVLTFQFDVVLAFTPGMKRIDLDRIWKTVRTGVANLSKHSRRQAPVLPADCPSAWMSYWRRIST